VNGAGFKAVLSGDGADEFLGGYDIYKETAIRAFWARRPDSRLRPLLLKRLYPDLDGFTSTSFDFLSAFFGQGLTDTQSPSYSHALRWRTTARAKRFYSGELRAAIEPDRDYAAAVACPPEFERWSAIERAQYLEAKIFLPQYLLSSQGDRVAMSHSVEVRFPFLDHRLVEFANRLPMNLKLRVLSEKHLLRRFAKDLLPDSIHERRKRPYRAPIHRAFFHASTPDYVRDMLSPRRVRAAGLFNADSVAQLVAKIERTGALTETDDMALAGILSAQLVQDLFVSGFRPAEPLRAGDDVKFVRSKSGVEEEMYAFQ
jgi:asparagine synthase (glutamine-hydrolysing)